MSAPEDRIAPGLWRLILAGAAAIVVITLAGALILAGGAADPALPGPLIWAQTADPGLCLDAASLDLPDLTVPTLVELSAASTDHAAWGVAIEDGSATQSWEVVPPGYVRYTAQTWPFHHVREDRNSLRLELLSPADDGSETEARWRLWINQERAAEGEIALEHEEWGLIGGEGVCWTQAAVYGSMAGVSRSVVLR